MRLDRFITLNLVRPFRKTFAEERLEANAQLPVLMFHSISDDPESGKHPYYRVCTRPTRFREQMQWLKDNDYLGVNLSKGLAFTGASVCAETQLTDATTSNLRPVVLTFDDGFRDFYTTAWPVLQEFGFTATMYLPTAFIGESRRQFVPSSSVNSDDDQKSNPNRHPIGRECLTWDEVEALHCAGIEFGSHTVNHPKLVELSWKQIEFELQSSRLEIENRLGFPCAAFSYPYAFPQANRDFTARFRDLLQAAGYGTCVTTRLGRYQPGDDVLQIKRLPVNQNDDQILFAAKLAGDYDWLASLQSRAKRMKSVLSIKPEPAPATPCAGQISTVK